MWDQIMDKSCACKDYVILEVDKHISHVSTQTTYTGSLEHLEFGFILKGLRLNPRSSTAQHALVTCLLVLVGVLSIVNLWRCPGLIGMASHYQKEIRDEKSNSPTSFATIVPDFVDDLTRVKRQSVDLTYAHLTGPISADHFNAFTSSDHQLYYMLWNATDHPNISNIEAQRASSLPVRRIQGLKVLSPGIYLVYSQIAIHGRQRHSTAAHYDCSHVTVRIRNELPVVLLKSLITQDNGGHQFRRHGRSVLPSDTGLQMGLFLLLPADEIRVGHSTSCDHVTYRNDHTNSYFGLVKLGNINQ